MDRSLKRAWVLLLAVLWPAVAGAQITLPYTFTYGTVIDQDQVNSNFTTVANGALNRTGGTVTGAIASSGGSLTGTWTGAPTFSGNLILSGNPTLSGTTALSGTASVTGTANFDADAIRIADTDASHYLIVTPGSNLTANRVFTLTTGDAARTVSFLADYSFPASQTANYYLQTNGSGTLTWAAVTTTRYQTTQTANYSVDFTNGTHQTVLCTTNAFAVTLPTAVGQAGKTVRVVAADTFARTLATTSSQTIAGLATGVPAVYRAGDFIEVESDGANWQLVGEKVTIYARAYLNANQTVTSGVATKVAFDTETEDSAAAFDSTTNRRFTVPRPGRYRVTASLYIEGANNTASHIAVYKNGSRIAFSQNAVFPSESILVATTEQRYTAVTDYIEVFGFHTRTSDTRFIAGATQTYVEITYIGN